MQIIKLQINNYQFTYQSQGDSSHPTILFLHGFMGDRDDFKPAIAALSKQYYCVAIDLIGHGRTRIAHQNTEQDSDRENYYTIQSNADFVINFLDFLRVSSCFLVGYSMGGRLALYLTIHFPQYFQRVVLESASAGLKTDAERRDRLAKDRKLASTLENCTLENGDFQLFLEKWYQQPIFANLRSHPNFSQMLAQRLNNAPPELAKSLRNASTGIQPSLWDKLAENAIPILLVAGELDVKFVQINQQMARLCKYAQLEIVPRCGHNVHFENPDLFIEKIKTFFC
jgi:2-succinyl-6-hydroxy-2,4-cyclohexadiene-1-carboxylate synthase